MKIEPLASIPAGSNPFLHDLYNMGTRVAKNLMVMHSTHDSQDATYIILVNTTTGERFRVTI